MKKPINSSSKPEISVNPAKKGFFFWAGLGAGLAGVWTLAYYLEFDLDLHLKAKGKGTATFHQQSTNAVAK